MAKIPKILIFGGSGLLATKWASLIKEVAEVTLALHKRQVSISGVGSVLVDLDSPESAFCAIKNLRPNIAINCVAMTSVETCEALPLDAWNANVIVAKNIALACSALNIKLVHISTDHVFNGSTGMMDELAASDPINVYGKTKLAGEIAVSNACPSALIMRTNFFGKTLTNRNSFSDTIINELCAGHEIELFCDAYFTPIYMRQLIEVSHELINRGESGLFNAVGDERLSKYEFGHRIARAFGLNANLIKPGLLKSRSDLVQRPLDLSLDNGKLCLSLGRNIGDVDRQLFQMKAEEFHPILIGNT